MALKIGIVSQKGGVGKSTLCRLIAREYAVNDWQVKIADMDISQGTRFSWHQRRLQNDVKPEISVEQYSRVDRVKRLEDNFDLIIFDGAPHSTSITGEIGKESDLVILPTGTPLDDLEPTVRLARELKNHNVDPSKIAVVLCRVGDSQREIDEAADYIKQAGLFLLDGTIPEKTSYKWASDTGRAVTETHYASLNEKADKVAQSIVDRIGQLKNGGV